MKKLILVFASSVTLIATYATVVVPGQLKRVINFTWEYDTNNLPDAFKLYTSTNVTTPVTNWNLIGTVSGNVFQINLSNVAFQQAAFYFVTASNLIGESDPSNIVGTPQSPHAVGNLRLTVQ